MLPRHKHRGGSMHTYELSIAAKMILGDDTLIKHPRAWVWHRIKRGEIKAFRVGGKYCMSLEQIAAAR
jgi:hypothetical protein